jgi:asparagine synthase (glutamine-hydrolysing)
MCGIAGFINLKEAAPVDEEVLARMTNTLIHRGPDSAGYFTEPGIGLGFRRLAIIDPVGGDQPLFNEDRSVVSICNGEIFNYRELRDGLMKRGHTFKTSCDVEVLAHLYEESGAGFLNQLNGQFAFAIYDRKQKRLLLARDHFGINPLFYTVAGNVLIFGSEIKAILQHPLVRPEVNLGGLDQIMSFPGLVSPQTMFKGIYSLKSGHCLIVSNGEVRVSEYWDLDYPECGEVSYDKPESYYVERLSELFERSVAYRLQADVPVGFYLSGGLDSSMIAAMISRLSTQKRHAFSISFT